MLCSCIVLMKDFNHVLGDCDIIVDMDFAIVTTSLSRPSPYSSAFLPLSTVPVSRGILSSRLLRFYLIARTSWWEVWVWIGTFR